MIRLLILAASLQGKVVFQDLPRQKLCVKGLSYAREFAVAKACSETVRIARIRGVSRESKGEPRLWLDRALLGPLRAEFNDDGWASPAPVALSPGKHSLSIECGDEAFEIEGLQIGEATPGPAPAKRKKGGAKAGALPPPTPQPTHEACHGLVENKSWLPGRPNKAILLSVVNGREIRTPLLSVLKRGEKLRWWFYVHPRPSKDTLRFPPILLECRAAKDGRWMLAFTIDSQEMLKALRKKKEGYEPVPKGYREDKWSSLDLELCPDGILHLSLNEGEVSGEFSVPGAEMPLLIQTSQIEFEIKGEK